MGIPGLGSEKRQCNRQLLLHSCAWRLHPKTRKRRQEIAFSCLFLSSGRYLLLRHVVSLPLQTFRKTTARRKRTSVTKSFQRPEKREGKVLAVGSNLWNQHVSGR